MPVPAPTDCIAGCAIAAIAAGVLGWLLRGCGLRRPWVIAGMLAGVLLGVQGLGRLDDRLFERFFMGAGQERRDLFIASRSIEIAGMAALPQGATVDESDLPRSRPSGRLPRHDSSERARSSMRMRHG
jgi:hypothetical protein